MGRCLTWVIGGAALSLSLMAPARAQQFPAKTIRIVVGFTAGSNSDSLARPLAKHLSDAIGQQVLVDNRPGASGNIGMAHVAKAVPDGYTIFSGPGSSITTNPHMQEHMPLDVVRDLVPITPIGQFTAVISVHPSVPARNIMELVALGKRQPGVLTFGSPGHGTGFHLAMELLKMQTGMKATHIPYAAVNSMLSDVMGGRVDMLLFSIIVTHPHIKTGKLRAIATTGATRTPVMPDVPTVAESGVPTYEYTGWHGLFAPASTPKEIVERLNTLIGAVLVKPEVRDFYATQNVEVLTMPPAAFAKKVRTEYETWGRLIREAGLKTKSQ